MPEFIEVKNEEDIRALTALASEIWYQYWVCLLDKAQISYMVEKFQSYDAVLKQIRDENYIYKFICLNGENVGYYGICAKDKKVWQSDNAEIQPYLFLSKLYLKEQYRGKGLGRAAFEDIGKIAHAKNLDYIYLTVNKYNTNTVKAYAKWGFNKVESAVTSIGQGFVMDDYIMSYNSGVSK